MCEGLIDAGAGGVTISLRLCWPSRDGSLGVCLWFLRPRSLTEQININEFAAVARKVITPYQTNVPHQTNHTH